VLANDSDGDGTLDPTSVVVVSGPAHGSVSVDPVSGEVTYTPDTNYHGSDSFAYTVDDDDGATSNMATVTVTVNDVNDPPVANDDTASTDEDTAVTIDVLGNDSDVDGTIHPTSVTIVSGPSHGSLSVDPVSGEVTYTPDIGYTGSDSFTYTVDDDDGDTSNVATVTVTVSPAGEPECVTIQRGSFGQVQDAYIWERALSYNANNARLYTGLVSGYEKRTLIRFGLDELPADVRVQSATFGIRDAWPGSGESINLFRVTAAWDEDEPTWGSFADQYAPQVWASFQAQVGWGTADLTPLVTAWLDGSLPNYGLMLIAEPGQDWDLYRSSEYSEVSQRPWLQVCYVARAGLGTASNAPSASGSAAPAKGVPHQDTAQGGRGDVSTDVPSSPHDDDNQPVYVLDSVRSQIEYAVAHVTHLLTGWVDRLYDGLMLLQPRPTFDAYPGDE
jgi:hypothetical protein